MTIHIHLVEPPEFYTNLDTLRGTVRLFLPKPETIGAIVVKVEGESSTTLQVPPVGGEEGWFYKQLPLARPDPADPGKPACALPPGHPMQETHKILYQVTQIHPPPVPGSDAPPPAGLMPAGQHSFPFQIRLPFNNACANPMELARSGGFVTTANDDDCDAPSDTATTTAAGKRTAGIKVMNASKQLLYHHVTQTLPPSFNGFLGQAEIRYFVKVTVQRPGMFKENWRNQTAFNFLPIEPVRPPSSSGEIFVNRPFTFRPRNASVDLASSRLRHVSHSFFNSSTPSSPLPPLTPLSLATTTPTTSTFPFSDLPQQQPLHARGGLQSGLAPSVRVTAFTPFPATLTCNEPIPLRVVAEKLAPSQEAVHLTSFFVRLVSNTRLRSQDLEHVKPTSFIVTSESDLCVLVSHPDAPVGSEISLPARLWNNKPLPTTVLPSFITCNVAREYRLEVRIGLAWGMPLPAGSVEGSSGGAAAPTPIALGPPPRVGTKLTKREKKERKAALKAQRDQPPAQAAPGLQNITLTLTFENVQVYSGIKPSQTLVDAATRHHERQIRERQHNNRGKHRQHEPPWQYYDRRRQAEQQRYHERNQGRGQERGQGRHQEQQQQRRPEQPFWLPHRQNTFELSASPPAPAPRQLDRATAASVSAGAGPVMPPVSPISPISPASSSAGPAFSIAELPARPVVRRRPIPAAFAAQQRLEQQQQQERLDRARREKMPLAEHEPPTSPYGLDSAMANRDSGMVGHPGPSQQYHLYQQQTDPLMYPVAATGLQHQRRHLHLQLRSSGGGGTAGGSYADGPSMSPRVAAVLDAFAFTDTQHDGYAVDAMGVGLAHTDADSPLYAYTYEEDPPPSYDEAMAEAVSGSGRAHVHGSGRGHENTNAATDNGRPNPTGSEAGPATDRIV